ncbi:helix-turn-helix domain-containing protein [Pseudoxanthomonas sangjuensis]|uniref:Crp/Fnr family transcriptional regulator n=1 Tax=Pseudoxanthomonas sangjuensis TaxID=1503750 RepID=UPI001391E139|nr:Crp/Fnr family transcriptional regulator [Pseudoxanthomonas sangjuensis]KAF1714273.1 Crp/Fnr family transcriptional regulator [Pseudoxanthomonas sangjuensis]
MNIRVLNRPIGQASRLRVVQNHCDAHGCTGCLVRHLAICSALPAEEAAALEQHAGDVVVPAGQVLAREGDTRRYVFTVTSGSLRRIRFLPDGRRLVAGFLMPGDFIGFSGATRYRHSIEAIEDSVLCAFSSQDMRELCDRYPELERELLERACVELDNTRNNLMSLARMTPVERLAGFLLDMAARRKRQGLDEASVALPMTRADIADYLGLTVETVSRCFTKLRSQGAIATDDPQHVRLLQPEALEALAEARG